MALPDTVVSPPESAVYLDGLSEILARHTEAHLKGAGISHPPAGASGPFKIKSWSTPDWLYEFSSTARSTLEQLVRPTFFFFKKKRSAYNLFGTIGMLTAGLVALSLTYAQRLSLSITLLLLLLALLISAGHVIVTVLITGKDRLVFLRYFLSIMAVSALFLRIIDRPIVPYLEVIALGLGAMQCLGRIGCFMAGCCHGRPHLLGVAYQQRQVTAGFSKYLVGVRLIPVQLIESVWIGFSVLLGVFYVLQDAPAGTGFSTYLILFSAGRFLLEKLRGDQLRTYRAGLSEAQWLSVLIIGLTVITEWSGIMPFQGWHFLIFGAIIISIIYFSLVQTTEMGTTIPVQIYELARVFNTFDQGKMIPQSSNKPVHLRKTLSGIQVSETQSNLPEPIIHLCSLSHSHHAMSINEARQLASIVMGWRPYAEKATLTKASIINENASIYHLIRYREEP